jgi:hypothetical protein
MTATDALQAWLALEHEAVWLYPVIGARHGEDRDRATASFEIHRITRDRLLARLREIGVEPVAPRLTYGRPVTTRATARGRARSVENRVAAACLTLAGESDDGTRSFAVKELRRAALAALTWGGEPEAFPGLD